MKHISQRAVAKSIRKQLAKNGFRRITLIHQGGRTQEEHWFNKDHIQVTIDFTHVRD